MRTTTYAALDRLGDETPEADLGGVSTQRLALSARRFRQVTSAHHLSDEAAVVVAICSEMQTACPDTVAMTIELIVSRAERLVAARSRAGTSIGDS